MPELTRKIKRNPDFPLQILPLNPWSLKALRRSSAKVYGTNYECIIRIYDVIKELHDVYKNLELYALICQKLKLDYMMIFLHYQWSLMNDMPLSHLSRYLCKEVQVHIS